MKTDILLSDAGNILETTSEPPAIKCERERERERDRKRKRETTSVSFSFKHEFTDISSVFTS